MSNINALTLASVSDIKAMVQNGVVTPAEALVRVDAVLARKSLTDSKKARWTRLREWLVNSRTETAEAA
jgi:hypothetical protein